MKKFLPVGRLAKAVRRISVVLFLGFISVLRVSAQGVVDDQVEYQALKDLYLATGGDAWLNNSNWPSSAWPATATSAEFDEWFGVVVENGDVVHLELNSNNLTNSLPASLANLTKLRQLYLGGNHLAGTFPTVIFSLSNLQMMDLAYNQFTGTIPSFASAQFNLWYLTMGANLFTGAFPDLSSQTNLNTLSLSYTAFSPGPIPTSMAGLTSISQLYLGRTGRTGAIPSFIGDYANLTTLSLEENAFTGAVPASIGNLSQLSILYIYSNQLESLPSTIGQLDNVYYLGIANNKLTSLPVEIGDMNGLVHLWAENNKLQSLPASLNNCPVLGNISVSKNELTSLPDLSSLTGLSNLQASQNRISGPIPAWISNMHSLSALFLDRNRLEGPLPTDWTSSLTQMNQIQLYNNNLSGPLPDISQWTNLQFLSIASNQFSGDFPEIPASLVLIDANYNQFTSIPSSVFSMSNPYYLNLYGSKIRTIRNIVQDIANGTVQPKSNTAPFYIGANYLDFTQLVPLKQLNLPIYAFPQRTFDDVTQVIFTEGGTLNIPTVPVNSTTTIIWEKNVNDVWTDVSTQTADATGHTYLRNSATLADEGLYRWRMTDSEYPGETLQSASIMVKERKNLALDDLSFQYRYDSRKRMIKKKVPGAAWVYMVYDDRDRLVLTQDGEQRKRRQWNYTRYDELNRAVVTGIYTHATVATQEQMAALIGTSAWNEQYTGNAANDGYTINAFTGSGFNSADNFYPLTVTYYDNYNFRTLFGSGYGYVNDGLSANVNGVPYDQAASNDYVTGQVTGTKVRALTGHQTRTINDEGKVEGSVGFWLKTVTYYDDKYRTIQAITDNIEGGTDRVSNLIDFVGKVLKTRSTHTVYDLDWQQAEGVETTGNTVTGVSDLAGWGSTGVSSGRKLAANTDGWIEAATYDKDTHKMIGLGSASPDANFNSMNYAIRATAGTLEIYESGNQVMGVSVPFNAGDVFRIARVGSVIKYYRNGAVIHETADAYAGELLLDISINANAATWYDIRTSYVSPRETFIDRIYKYDHAGRLLEIGHGINGQTPVLLSLNKYNELGQLVDKKLHSRQDGSDSKQSVDYRYNIRGWVTSINNTALSNDTQTNDDTGDFFGMNLNYEKPVTGVTTTADVQYNGNISSITYSNSLGLGAIKGRGYAFKYDPMNRLTDVRHKEAAGASGSLTWSPVDAFREHITGYDLNGNITGLNRTNKDGGYQDVLSYQYSGNQLVDLTDYSRDGAGFRDQTQASTDYSYDSNGNMTRDNNKSVNYISYSHLNLPQYIRKHTGEFMFYLYDASGRKLGQHVFDGNRTLTKRSDYAGEFFYENGKLQFINHEEGRVVMKEESTPEYQYNLKDHLGNVRLTFTTKAETETTIATLEDDEAQTEQGQFLYYDEAVTVDQPLFDYTHRRSGENHTTTKSTRLLGGNTDAIYGLAKSVSVMPGDVINMQVYAKYVDTEQTNWNAALQSVMAAVANPASPGAAIDNGASGSLGTQGLLFPPIDHANDETTGPKAYLNYIVFGRDITAPPLDMGFVPVPANAMESGTDIDHMLMAASITIKEAGYVYIYLSNENPTPVEVYFDDFKVEHVKSPIIQTDDYYPGGAVFNSYSREESVQNKVLFQETEFQSELGLQLYDFGGRLYDGFIWRTPTNDPHADFYQDISPYSFLDNNPINTIDPTGMDVLDVKDQSKSNSFNPINSKMLFNFENENPKESFNRNSSFVAVCPSCDPKNPEHKKFIDDPNNFYNFDSGTGQVNLIGTALPEVEISSTVQSFGLEGFEHLYGPGFTLLTSPSPKRFMAKNASQQSSVLSETLSKMIEKPIRINGKKRLYTHTVNGSRRYAATWGRYLGRWGTRVLGPVGAGLLIYDGATMIYNAHEYFKTLPINQQFDGVNYQMHSGSYIPPSLRNNK